MSKGENRIVDILNKDKIRYEREKTFNDLKHGLFRYDFYIYVDGAGWCIVEFQGEQHYKYIKQFFKTQQEWKQAQGRDMRKISYALAHNIPIYLIPYWELDKLHTYKDLINPMYRARDRFKNFSDYFEYKKNHG